MRIAITADPYLPVPPVHYGGIERVVDFLVRGLIARGHEVTLFAHPESRTPARLIGYGAPPHFGPVHRMRELVQVGAKLFAMRGELDVVHSFGRLAALAPVLPLESLPKIQSYQRAIPRKGVARALRLSGRSLRFAACSTHLYEAGARPVEGQWTTIFNGVELEKYTCVPEVPADAPLVFLGRLERLKGPHHAIAIAKAAGRRLLIAGNIVRDTGGSSFYDAEIAPHIDGQRVQYVGPVDDVEKNALLGTAAALLMPIEWEEPFGIVMAEAMACGTPVIAFARGSAPELIREGVNGLLCDDVPSAAEALSRLGEIDRVQVREDAARRFASGVIVTHYERLYRAAAETVGSFERATLRG